MHGDLKPHNILYDKTSNKFILIDFSNAINFFELAKYQKVIIPGGSYLYSSPNTKEILIKCKPENEILDSYNFKKNDEQEKPKLEHTTFLTG